MQKAIQDELFVPKANERQPGWLTYKDQVVVITFPKVEGHPVHILGGFIASWPGSHGDGFEVDNISKTVVWFDEPINNLSDNADDAYEKSFDVKDPLLIKVSEIGHLRSLENALAWFDGQKMENGRRFTSDIIRMIADQLAIFDAGKQKRPKTEMEEFLDALGEDRKKNPPWWSRQRKKPTPPVGIPTDINQVT